MVNLKRHFYLFESVLFSVCNNEGSMTMKCSRCGEEILTGEEFCGNCGMKAVDSGRAVHEDNGALSVSPATSHEESESHALLGKTKIDIRIPDMLPEKKRLENVSPSEDVPCSDCCDFRIEWNQGASIFFSNIASSIQFRITPLTDAAQKASSFRMLFRFPGNDSLREERFPFNSIRRQIPKNINYTPGENIGINQSVDMYFNYLSDDREHWYFQQFQIDIHPGGESKDKILENLTINIGNIVQEGKAGDPRISFLENLKRTSASPNEILEKLKNTPLLWTALDLFESSAPEDGHSHIRIPPPPAATGRIVLRDKNGMKIIVCSGEAVLGRRKDCDITVRNLPDPGTEWTQEELQRRNERISGKHCRISVDDGRAAMKDLNSTNGTFLEGVKIGNAPAELPVNSNVDVSLGGGSQLCFKMVARAVREAFPKGFLPEDDTSAGGAVGAVVIRRCDRISETYIVLNRAIQLSSFLKDAPHGWAICRYRSSIGVTNGRKWCWLAGDTKPPPETGLEICRPDDGTVTGVTASTQADRLNRTASFKMLALDSLPVPDQTLNFLFGKKTSNLRCLMSRYEISQIAAFAFNSPYIQQNSSYMDRVSRTAFIYDDETALSNLVNAFAAEKARDLERMGIAIGADDKKSVIIIFKGLVTAASLAGLCLALDHGRKTLLTGIREIGGRIVSNEGFFTEKDFTDIAGKLKIDLDSVDDIALKSCKSFTAAMLLNIISHELGHVALFHTKTTPPLAPQVSRNNERQADLFASSVVSVSLFNDYLVAGSIVWWIIQSWVDKVPRFEESTHPESRERLFNFINANRKEAESLGFDDETLKQLLP